MNLFLDIDGRLKKIVLNMEQVTRHDGYTSIINAKKKGHLMPISTNIRHERGARRKKKME